MSKSRSSLRIATVGVAVACTSTMLAPQASANSFTEVMGHATGERITVSYKDGSDKFCVDFAPTRVTDTYVVKLWPVRGRGKSYEFEVRQGTKNNCISLKRTYEDTRYAYKLDSDMWDYVGTQFYS